MSDRCEACGLASPRSLCYFCEYTAQLIRERKCVSCAGPINDADSERFQGKCPDCLARHHRMFYATKWLLHQYAKARSIVDKPLAPTA